MESSLRAVLKEKEVEATFHRIGSMFCLFFAAEPIEDVAAAKRSDLKRFAKFFHACMDKGVYFAPSQFETGFISTAHTSDDIDRTAEVVRAALA